LPLRDRETFSEPTRTPCTSTTNVAEPAGSAAF